MMRLWFLWTVPVVVGWWSLAWAHDWYPRECCSAQDCFVVPPEDIQEVDEGWNILPSGEFIPRAEARISPDGQYHRCTSQGVRERKTLGALWGPEQGRTCFWTPFPGV